MRHFTQGVRQVEIRVFIGKVSKRFVKIAPAGQLFPDKAVEDMLDSFATNLEQKYPRVEFRLVPLGRAKFNIIGAAKPTIAAHPTLYGVVLDAQAINRILNDHCPKCGSELDTGYECNNRECGYDAKPVVDWLREQMEKNRPATDCTPAPPIEVESAQEITIDGAEVDAELDRLHQEAQQ